MGRVKTSTSTSDTRKMRPGLTIESRENQLISLAFAKKTPLSSLPFETYIFGVTASEIGNASLEACKAQAVAARTTALPYLQNGKPIPDTGVQAFRADRIDENLYPNAYKGAGDTAGEVLTYNGALLSPCSFSASNGGKTTSSGERWGGFRPYLVEQDDPYDFAATGGKKTGHGVGMSQLGAAQMARLGFLTLITMCGNRVFMVGLR